jgi:hypothetical protein
LAISLALPTFAQQKESTPNEQDRQWLDALVKKFDEAYNNNDAAALAAFYAEDAVIVTDTGPIYGRDAIEKHFADLFKQVHFSNHISKADQYSPHMIGTTDKAWSNEGMEYDCARSELRSCRNQGLLVRRQCS